MRSGELYALTWGVVDFERNLITVSKQWTKKDGLVEWTQGEQSKVLREFCKATNIKEVKFHDLRTTFITNMLSLCVPLVKVMSIVGHKKMETTDIYLRLAGVDIKGATDALTYTAPATTEIHDNVISVNFSKA